MSKLKARSCSAPISRLPLVTKPLPDFISELQTLSRHNRHRGCLAPTLAGHVIDLRKLYNEVALRGGHKRVTLNHEWSAIYLTLGLPPGCSEAGHGIRAIYQRYLERFERQQRLSRDLCSDDVDASVFLDGDSQDMDTDYKSQVQHCVNDQEIPNHLRATWNLSPILADRVEYMSLEHALQSGLPNEIDFALNTLLLMSCQSNDFSLHKNVRLLSLLLQSVGITEHSSIPRFESFWTASIPSAQGRAFLHRDIFSSPLSSHLNSAKPVTTFAQHPAAFGEDEDFRIQLVATILRNLAVGGGMNAVTIGRDPQALRFILLCIYANQSYLHQLGLEILSSLHFPVAGVLHSVIQQLVHELLCSDDRNDRIRGLQLLRHLCEVPVYVNSRSPCDKPVGDADPALPTDRNLDLLLSLKTDILHAVVTSLCVKDVFLLILALDSLYSLSALGTVFCERLLLHSSHNNADLRSPPRLVTPIGFLNIILRLIRFDASSIGEDGFLRVTCHQTPEPVPSAHKKSSSTSRVSANSSWTAFSSCASTSTCGSSEPVPNFSTREPMPRSAPSRHGTIQKETAPNSRQGIQLDALLRPLASPMVQTSLPTTAIPTSSIVITPIHPCSQSTNSVASSWVSPCSTSRQPPVIQSPILSTNSSERIADNSMDSCNHVALSTESEILHKPSPSKLIKVAPRPVSAGVQDSGHREFAQQWLLQHCFARDHFTVSRLQLYTAYQSAHRSRFGSGSPCALSLNELHSELKSAFPAVEQINVQDSGGNSEVYYTNLSYAHNSISNGQQSSALSNSESHPRDSIHKAVKRTIDNLRTQSGDENRTPVHAELSAGSYAAKRKLPCSTSNGDAATALHGSVPTNGLTKDIAYVISSSLPINRQLTSLTNGDGLKLCTEGGRLTLARCANLNDLIAARENNLVLLPVFTAVNLRPTMNQVARTLTPAIHANAIQYPGLTVRFATLARTPFSPVSSVADSSAATCASSATACFERNGSPGLTGVRRKLCNSAVFTCRWADCVDEFSKLDGLIAHVEDHLSHETETKCLWADCQCCTLFTPQSLLEHIRASHTIKPARSPSYPLNSGMYSLSDLLQNDSSPVDGVDLASLLKSDIDQVSSASLISGASHSSLSATPTLQTVLGNESSSSSKQDAQFHATTGQDQKDNCMISSNSRCLWSPTFEVSEDCKRALKTAFSNPPFESPSCPEEPITKHVRLTAALVLKNFLNYSQVARKLARSWEGLLCELAFSAMDSAPVIFECLSLLHRNDTPSPPKFTAVPTSSFNA